MNKQEHCYGKIRCRTFKNLLELSTAVLWRKISLFHSTMLKYWGFCSNIPKRTAVICLSIYRLNRVCKKHIFVKIEPPANCHETQEIKQQHSVHLNQSYPKSLMLWKNSSPLSAVAKWKPEVEPAGGLNSWNRIHQSHISTLLSSSQQNKHPAREKQNSNDGWGNSRAVTHWIRVFPQFWICRYEA